MLVAENVELLDIRRMTGAVEMTTSDRCDGRQVLENDRGLVVCQTANWTNEVMTGSTIGAPHQSKRPAFWHELTAVFSSSLTGIPRPWTTRSLEGFAMGCGLSTSLDS